MPSWQITEQLILPMQTKGRRKTRKTRRRKEEEVEEGEPELPYCKGCNEVHADGDL